MNLNLKDNSNNINNENSNEIDNEKQKEEAIHE